MPGFRPTAVLLPHFQFWVAVDTAAGGVVLRDLTINPVTFTGWVRIEGIQLGAREPENAPFPDSVRFGADGRVTLLMADSAVGAPLQIEPQGIPGRGRRPAGDHGAALAAEPGGAGDDRPGGSLRASVALGGLRRARPDHGGRRAARGVPPGLHRRQHGHRDRAGARHPGGDPRRADLDRRDAAASARPWAASGVRSGGWCWPWSRRATPAAGCTPRWSSGRARARTPRRARSRRRWEGRTLPPAPPGPRVATPSADVATLLAHILGAAGADAALRPHRDLPQHPRRLVHLPRRVRPRRVVRRHRRAPAGRSGGGLLRVRADEAVRRSVRRAAARDLEPARRPGPLRLDRRLGRPLDGGQGPLRDPQGVRLLPRDPRHGVAGERAAEPPPHRALRAGDRPERERAGRRDELRDVLGDVAAGSARSAVPHRGSRT